MPWRNTKPCFFLLPRKAKECVFLAMKLEAKAGVTQLPPCIFPDALPQTCRNAQVVEVLNPKQLAPSIWPVLAKQKLSSGSCAWLMGSSASLFQEVTKHSSSSSPCTAFN